MKDLIALRLKDMTPGQEAVARYLIDHPKEGAFLTARQLGKRVGVSETTVIRLAHLLGFKGYSQLRQEVANRLMDHFSTLERIKDYSSADENSLYERALQKDMDSLSEAQASIPAKELDDLGEQMVRAGAVYLAGYRSSSSLVSYLAFYLSWILPRVRIIPLDMPFEMLVNAPQNSLVLAISFPRYSRWTVEVLCVAEDLGLDTATITDGLTSPLAALSKFVVSVPYQPVSFIDSFAAPMSLLNCLILSVARHIGAGVTEKMEALEKHWEEEQTYIPDRRRTSSRR